MVGDSSRRPLVVVVHGLGRTTFSMWPVSRAVERAGFEVMAWGYSSTGPTVAQLGARLAAAVADRAHPGPVHFVTHSLGGVLVRAALARGTLPRVGRIVMVTPPNRGARAADFAAPLLGWLLRPLRELTTDEASAARTLPVPAGVEIGVIAGDRDVKVRVAETHLPGETDHVVVRGGHSLLLWDRKVQALVVEFLRTGRFGPRAG